MNELSTRVGTIVYTGHTTSLSGQRDIGGSLVANSDRIVLVNGPSDIFKKRTLKICVSDDGGKTFHERFCMPAIEDVSYHTAGLLYDQKNAVIMALFGEVKGFRLFDKDNQNSDGDSLNKITPEHLGRSKLLMARSIDNGETWSLFELHDYSKDPKAHTVTGGITGCGVQKDNDTFGPQFLITTNDSGDALRWAILLSRIRTLDTGNTESSFEFENDFRVIASDSDTDICYADETVYIKTLDGSGYLSFHRSNTGTTMEGGGTPFRREYDNNHNPTSYFTRIMTQGFDPRDYDPGMNGPIIIAFNIIRMLDGHLLMASRFYGTTHHKAGNIFMTSRDEGRNWYYEDDQIPYSLDPLRYWPKGSGGNPSMSYLSDASLIHTTSTGGGTLLPDTGSFVTRFRGITSTFQESTSSEGVLCVDVSDVVALEPIYIANIEIVESQSLHLQGGDRAFVTEFTSDRQSVRIPVVIEGKSPSIRLRIALANRCNGYRPFFEPTFNLM